MHLVRHARNAYLFLKGSTSSATFSTTFFGRFLFSGIPAEKHLYLLLPEPHKFHLGIPATTILHPG